MKLITHYFQKKGIIFKEFESIDPKKLQTRKKIEIFCGTTIHKEYYALFVFHTKSRFVQKNAYELFELLEKLSRLKDHNFKKKYIFITAPMCSKAKALLEAHAWDRVHDTL